MNTALMDAAFRFFSLSLISQDGTRPPTSKMKRIAELQSQFPETDVSGLENALVCAKRLEETAVEMAELHRSDNGPALDVETISARCPGFSDASYQWAINDGFMMTR